MNGEEWTENANDNGEDVVVYISFFFHLIKVFIFLICNVVAYLNNTGLARKESRCITLMA